MSDKKADIQVNINEIRGDCPVFEEGDTFCIKDGYILEHNSDKELCTHALINIIHWANSLSRGISPYELGLAKKEGSKSAFLQCPDPGKDFTGGGTVIFELKVID